MVKPAPPPAREAQSYWMVADAQQWFGYSEDVRWRAHTEEYARDSMENLMFSVCRFYELAGHYPDAVTVVTLSFKAPRFVDHHRRALRYPRSCFGVVASEGDGADANGRPIDTTAVDAAFGADPYACGDELGGKKLARNPFHRTHSYAATCPEMAGLLGHCGASVYADPLPWDGLVCAATGGTTS